MSRIHRVVRLNKPLKIGGFTPWQWVLMVIALALAFLVGSKLPGDWKVGNLPAGFLVGLLIFCGALVYIQMSQMKPFAWWRNQVLYKLKLVPDQFLPRTYPGIEYPDSSIHDDDRKVDEYYVGGSD